MKRPIWFAVCIGAASPAVSAEVFDDFERHLLGPNWIVLAGAGSIGLVGQSDLGLVAGPARGGAVAWAANTFLLDEFSEAVISPDRADSMLLQVYVRLRAVDNARYGFHWNNAFGGRWEIKYDGVPTPQTRILASAIAPEPLPGDRIRIEARGATISGYHNEVLVLTAEDTAPDAITEVGELGVVFRFTTTAPAVYPSAVVEDWMGGDLPAASVDPEPGVAAPLLAMYPNPGAESVRLTLAPELDWRRCVLSVYDARGRAVLVDCPIDSGTGMCYTRACLPSLFLSWTTRHDESWKAGFDRERCARTKCGARA
jgi:hypothetical protein